MKVSHHAVSAKEVTKAIWAMCRGVHSLVAEAGWNEESLLSAFLHSFASQVDRDSFIALAICIGSWLCESRKRDGRHSREAPLLQAPYLFKPSSFSLFQYHSVSLSFDPSELLGITAKH